MAGKLRGSYAIGTVVKNKPGSYDSQRRIEYLNQSAIRTVTIQPNQKGEINDH
ncbi:MAG: hypothetical protein Q7K57_08545 [Burkholderiaceae bacterium]|nr:hypothetical protein [Burkholderiaceae bacterium]